MPDLLHLTTEQWIDFWTGVATVILGLAALAGTVAAVGLTREANGREERRDERQDRDRVDRWLAEFLVEVSSFGEACAVWLNTAEDVDIRWTGHPDEAPMPPEPSAGRLLAQLDAAWLVSTGKDSEILRLASTCAHLVVERPVRPRAERIENLAFSIRLWWMRLSTYEATQIALEARLREEADWRADTR